MDVTLERVQFKFASIIGELCSKPVILSQFAIWVDLRLAEYKLRGSISLDCSGDKPDPDWLKGMRNGTDEFLEEYRTEGQLGSPSASRRQNISVGDSNEVSMNPHLQQVDIPERLDSGAELQDTTTIVIKNDSDDDVHDVFPTGLHFHKSQNFNNSRKRSRASRGDDQIYSAVHNKVSKSSEPSMTPQSSNQSLMSIIGGQDSMHEASPVSLEETQRDLDLAMAIQMQESQQMGDNSSAVTFIHGRPSSHVASAMTHSNPDIDVSFSSPPNKSDAGMWLLSPGRHSPAEAMQAGMVELLGGSGVYLYPQLLKSALDLCITGNRQGRRCTGALRDGQPAARFLLSVFFSRDKIVNGTLSQTADHMEVLDPVIVQVITGMPTHDIGAPAAQVLQSPHSSFSEDFVAGRTMATVRKTRSDLNIFYGWLQSEPYRDCRQIEDIPPDELDNILADMYATLKPRDGGEYDPKSLKSVRNSLERHLRDQGYPASTVAPGIFTRSQEAYKKRIQDLKESAFLSSEELSGLREKIFEADLSNTESLLITMFWLTSFYFPDCLVSKVDHFNLLWGDVELLTKDDGREYLVLTASASKSRPGKHPVTPSACEALADTDNPKYCPVRAYKLYAKLRPPCCGAQSKFYNQLCVPAETGELTLAPTPAPMRMVSSILKTLKERASHCLSIAEPLVDASFPQPYVQ